MLGLALGPMGTFYVITLYVQKVREYSPLVTGLSWLPFAAGIILGAGIAPKLLLKFAPRYIAASRALLGSAGALWFSRITVDTEYWTRLAPAMLVIALGFGLGVIALTQTAVYRIDEDKAGIASALMNSAQQIGVALGLAILAGVAASVTAGTGSAGSGALVDGYSAALWSAQASCSRRTFSRSSLSAAECNRSRSPPWNDPLAAFAAKARAFIADFSDRTVLRRRQSANLNSTALRHQSA